jgi:hypothetical protein
MSTVADEEIPPPVSYDHFFPPPRAYGVKFPVNAADINRPVVSEHRRSGNTAPCPVFPGKGIFLRVV